MPRPGVTRDQVHQAADALAAEGANPTVVAVRKRLGGGSPNRITPWLAEWREAQAAIQVVDLPEIPQAIDNAIRHLWALAWQQARAQLATERQALNGAQKAVETEREELLAEISRLEDSEDAREQIQSALITERQAHDQTRAETRTKRSVILIRGNVALTRVMKA
ncbi:DNA-binding protein [Lamprobacter modestohalophilus]|uniref:DNA-binding protein n=1 Tax=Lamprobacter modestohalophilus TaxID=1064514 RepID=UPI002ADEDB0E|nr:DNA-binding protein [Lamprobacter modestohalophilus]MEA1053109.1 DNA-binding protein [Lamprobacter modestohalophilus]